MRQWRVGTLSMGLLLVFTGAGLLYAQLNKLAVVDFSLKWWPVIFVLLGIEVLVQNYLRKDENNPLKYDVFSIIIILFIVLAGLGLQTIQELGLVEHARTMISSQIFVVPDSAEIPLEPAIKKIVLETGGNQVDVHSSQSNTILARSTLHVRAQSKTEAQTAAAQYTQISQQKAGHTLYLQLPPHQGSEPILGCGYSLVLPDNVAVEIAGTGGSLDLSLASLQNNWEITGGGSCSVKLPDSADVTVNALVDHEEALRGNLAWTISKINPTANPSNSPEINPEHPEQYGPERNMERQVQAQAKLGNGSHKMNILNVDNLTVNHLP